MISLANEKSPSAVMLTAKVPDPTGYGRVIRDNLGNICQIVEEIDAKIEERMINEVNTGVYLFSLDDIWKALENVKPHNNQNEYYLTDAIKILYGEGKTVISQTCEDISEYHGINNRWDMTQIAGHLQHEILKRHSLNGVTIIDPSSTYIEATVKIANDVVIYPYVYLQGDITIDEDCKIGPFLFLKGEDKGIRISKGVEVGPFVRMRPPVDISENAKIGCFIDMKKVKVGKGSKIPHLSYVGDTEMGEDVNIGAGTITCNYDGVNKNKTKIGDRVFIGSDTMLVAPIEIGDDAYTGAGSVINRNVPEGSLGIERSPMNIVEGWAKRKKHSNKKEKHG
jgi:bifunctional UDP-N-acetylglucosamine pyrophosphorylase/glucosamine-1-phosphate N-acetyltransferase